MKPLALALSLLAAPALAAPPPGTDPSSPLAHWVQSLRGPDGILCCSLSDCRHTRIETRQDGTHWAWIGREEYGPRGTDQWEPISDRVWDETTADGPPPGGVAFACWYAGEVRCAMVGGGS